MWIEAGGVGMPGNPVKMTGYDDPPVRRGAPALDEHGTALRLGARVPIILTSRADSVMTRLASCAVAVLVAEARRANGTKAVS